MKLPLGLGFALLLILQSFHQMSTQEEDLNLEESTQTPEEDLINSGLISGNYDNQFTNHTTEDETMPSIMMKEADDNDVDSVTSTPSPYVLNISREHANETDRTSILKFNSSNPITSRPPVTNETHLNTTVTPHPGTNSTESGFGRFPSNVTTINTFRNSTSRDNVNSTTPHPTKSVNTTTQAPDNVTFPTSFTILLTNESTTLDQFTIEDVTKRNRTGGFVDYRDNSGRGVVSDVKHHSRNQSWGAIIGVGVAMGIVALVVYVILKQKKYRDFSHRKLVEDMPPDPVLRLDNSEPLDMKYDGFAYYNPGLQGDNIQMTNLPRGQSN